MKKMIMILLWIVSIYAEDFNFIKIQKCIKEEIKEEKVYVNYLKEISSNKQQYVSIEFANASTYMFYILLSINEQKITMTKYNFNPNGAYSFSVQYIEDSEFAIKNFLNNFIDESKIHSNITYEDLNQVQFNTEKYSILLTKKNRLPISNIYLNNKDYFNNTYIEPIFNKNVKLIGFYIYKNKIIEEDIMLQSFKEFVDKNEISLDELIKVQKSFTLKDIEQTIKEKRQLEIYDKKFFQNLLETQMLAPKTLTQYNNIAYYLEQAEAYKESAYLLEKIIEKYPTRIVAHYNLGDAYWGLGEKEKAIASYNTYIQQMKANGKEKRIPQVVLDRVNTKEAVK